MTDNEIIKALKCCGILGTYVCDEECPMLNNEIRIASDCRKKLHHYALTLINRQQAEIERLKIENQSLRGAANSYKIHYNEARTEAVGEFADRLKDRIVNLPSAYPIESATLAFLNGNSHRQLEILEIINDLVKEMAGDTK